MWPDDLGQSFRDAVSSVQQAGHDAASAASSAYGSAVKAAGQAVDTVQQAGASAYHATVNAASYVADKTQQAAAATYDAGKTVAKKAAAATVIGGEGAAAVTVAGGVVAARVVGNTVGPVVNTASKAYKAVNSYLSPAKPVVSPCIECLNHSSAQARAARINKRNQLIGKAMAGNDPAARAQAQQLKGDMKAVEMARLSENAYGQYKSPPVPPPEPWKVMSDDDLTRAGISPGEMHQAKAVLYQAPADFPMDPKTVLAFRGTDPSDPQDLLTDHDQALGLETTQYTAAKNVGSQVGGSFPDAEVTGHSLGGGKAQAAGITGNMNGMMFNSAGLNPQTMNMPADGLNQYSNDFQQYRAQGGLTSAGGDPLTGIQNSPTAQSAVYGVARGAGGVLSADQWARNQLGMAPLTGMVPAGQRDLASQFSDRLINVTADQAKSNYQFSGGKWYIPPAVGAVKGLDSKNADGTPTSAANQHSITNMVNGFEYRKFNNIESLLKSTNTPGNAKDYLGPTEIQMK